MLKLYALLANIIEPICPCFVDHYPETETMRYPYVAIKASTIPNNSFSDNNLLEVDVWSDNGPDITECETITAAIHKELNRLQVNNADFNLSINRNTPHVLPLDDTILHVIRRQLRYICTVYEK